MRTGPGRTEPAGLAGGGHRRPCPGLTPGAGPRESEPVPGRLRGRGRRGEQACGAGDPATCPLRPKERVL